MAPLLGQTTFTREVTWLGLIFHFGAAPSTLPSQVTPPGQPEPKAMQSRTSPALTRPCSPTPHLPRLAPKPSHRMCAVSLVFMFVPRVASLAISPSWTRSLQVSGSSCFLPTWQSAASSSWWLGKVFGSLSSHCHLVSTSGNYLGEVGRRRRPWGQTRGMGGSQNLNHSAQLLAWHYPLTHGTHIPHMCTMPTGELAQSYICTLVSHPACSPVFSPLLM